MQRLNDAAILDQMEGHTNTLLMIALWKARGDKITTITAADIQAFNQAHGGAAILYLHGHADSISLGVVTKDSAEKIAAHQAATTSKETH